MQTTNPQADVPLLTSEVARILNKSPETVRWYERTGRLHAVRTVTGVRLFSRRDVERLLAETAIAAARRRVSVDTQDRI